VRERRRVLITGAAGFVGVNLVRDFAADDTMVVALDRNEPSDAHRDYVAAHSRRVEWNVCDLRDRESVELLVRQGSFDAIIHAAAITPADDSIEKTRASEIFDVNLCSALHLCESAIASNVRRTIVLGSGAAMGQRPAQEVSIAEDAIGRPAGLYGIAKLALEQAVLRMRNLTGADLTVTRIAQPFGPMELATRDRLALSPIADWMTTVRSGRPIVVVDPDAARDWIYIRDLTAAFRLLVDAPMTKAGLYNIGPGRLTTVREVVGAIVAVWPEATVVHDRSASFNRNLRKEALRPMLDVQRFTTEFGFAPRFAMAEGIADTARWMEGTLSEPSVRSPTAAH
jgi:UDP-glucuronate 4-epimerase